jgi:hypothetical protein
MAHVLSTFLLTFVPSMLGFPPGSEQRLQNRRMGRPFSQAPVPARALLLVCLFWTHTSCKMADFPPERQLTFDLSYNHDLDNNDNFSPDDEWLVYDVRTDEGGIGACPRIEKVHVTTGEKVVLYQLPDNQPFGPGVGAVSYSPLENKVAFIHGLASVSAENPYQQWRRTGVIIDEALLGQPIFMDARNLTPPFTPGALRGGTHRHEWSGDGRWIGFTYNDALMQEREQQTGQTLNLRTIGVSKNTGPVQIEPDEEGENLSGQWYSVLVVRVVPNPAPGSDEISRAASDSWVGTKGYPKPDGSYQLARSFLGTVRGQNGQPVDEVFVVDIPERIDVPGEYGPLEGTPDSFPMPPQGTVQRRLTYTARSPFPGCSSITRSSPDGRQIAYLARDQNGVKQVFLISPTGGQPTQLTDHPTDVPSGVRWHPNGKQVCYLWDNSLVLCELGDAPFAARHRRLTSSSLSSPSNPVWSHNGQTIAFNRLVSSAEFQEPTKQIFLLSVP